MPRRTWSRVSSVMPFIRSPAASSSRRTLGSTGSNSTGSPRSSAPSPHPCCTASSQKPWRVASSRSPSSGGTRSAGRIALRPFGSLETTRSACSDRNFASAASARSISRSRGSRRRSAAFPPGGALRPRAGSGASVIWLMVRT